MKRRKTLHLGVSTVARWCHPLLGGITHFHHIYHGTRKKVSDCIKKRKTCKATNGVTRGSREFPDICYKYNEIGRATHCGLEQTRIET